MKRKSFNLLPIDRKEKLSLNLFYNNVEKIPEKIIKLFPLLDYIIIDYEKLEKKLSLMIDESTREEQRKTLEKEKKQREEIYEIIKPFINNNRKFTIKKFNVKKKGGFYYNDDDSTDYEDEFEDYYEEYEFGFTLDITFNDENNKDWKKRFLSFSIRIDQEIDNIHHDPYDICPPRAYFKTNTNVDLDEDLSEEYKKKGIKKIIDEKDVKKLTKTIYKKFIKDKIILKKIKENILYFFFPVQT